MCLETMRNIGEELSTVWASPDDLDQITHQYHHALCLIRSRKLRKSSERFNVNICWGRCFRVFANKRRCGGNMGDNERLIWHDLHHQFFLTKPLMDNPDRDLLT